jgi:hypothetical protein
MTANPPVERMASGKLALMSKVGRHNEDRRLGCSDSENPANPRVKELGFVPQPSLRHSPPRSGQAARHVRPVCYLLSLKACTASIALEDCNQRNFRIRLVATIRRIGLDR